MAAAEKLENGEFVLTGINKQEISAKINAKILMELKKQEDDQANAIKKIEEKIRCFQEPLINENNNNNFQKSKNISQLFNETKIQQNYFKYQVSNSLLPTAITTVSYLSTNQEQIQNTECSKIDIMVSQNMCATSIQQSYIPDAFDATHELISPISSPSPTLPLSIQECKLKFFFFFIYLLIYLSTQASIKFTLN